MITRFFQRANQNWMLGMGAIGLWIAAIAALLQFYAMTWSIAFLFSSIISLLILGGFLLLEKIFKYFQPSRTNFWAAFIFPILLTIFVLYVGDWLLSLTSDKTSINYIFWEHLFPLRALLLFLLFTFCTIGLVFYGQLEAQIAIRKREETANTIAKEAELYHLKQQLQPHFLFNSLNSVSALIGKEPERARTMVLQLSDFLRETIKKDDQKWLSIAEEKAYLSLFMEIEKVRFGHRLSVDFQVAEEANACSLPPLLVQPLLENAVKHGLYGTTDKVHISLSVRFEQPYLIISISNPYDPMAGQAKGSGFGLEGINRRLYLIFGRHDLLIIKKEANLFTITLKIPQRND